MSQGGKYDHVNVQDCVSMVVLCVHAYMCVCEQWRVSNLSKMLRDTSGSVFHPPQITIYVELHASALAALNLYLLIGKRDDKNTYLVLVSLS